MPDTIPAAVATPATRPPSSVFRIVSAVSWPGVTMTRIEIPMKAASSPSYASCAPHSDGAMSRTRVANDQSWPSGS